MCDVDDATELFELLTDPYAGVVLAAVTAEPVTPQTICSAFKISHSTVYRRLNELQEQGLLSEDLYLDEMGNNYSEYYANFQQLSLTIHNGQIELSVQRAERETEYCVLKYDE